MRIYVIIFVLVGILSSSLTFAAEQVETEYFAVFMQGKKAGYAVQTRAVDGDKVTTTEESGITINRMGAAVTVNTKETSIETIEAEPLGFVSVQELSGMAMKMAGTIDRQGMVELTITSVGPEQKRTLEWPGGAVMSEGLRLLALRKGLKEGLKYNARVFSPSMLQALESEIQIGRKQNVDLLGRVVALTKVVNIVKLPGAGEIVSRCYVDDELRVQKNIIPIMGIDVEMIACAKEFALSENEPFEVVNMMFLESPRPLGDIGSAGSISYYLSPVEEANKPAAAGTSLKIPSTDSQSVRAGRDGRVVVTVRPAVAPQGAAFPYKGSDETILAATRPTRFVQSDHEEIIKLARRAVGDTRDAGQAARRIEAFVADYIEVRNLSVGYASAAEVAASRQGDCSEFSVLTAAMCRAVGIAAQVVMGIAYIEDFAGLKNRFGGHAWVQAYVGDKWVGLDASFKKAGRGGCGPGHIALAVGNGDPEDFFELVSILGRFRIDRVVVEKTEFIGEQREESKK